MTSPVDKYVLLRELTDVIRKQTVAFRKGEVYREEEKDGLKVIHINDFPETPLHGTIVDVHFVNVGFTEAAADKQAFIDAVCAVVDGQAGEFQQLSYKDLESGPSYITLGAWLGSQQLALQFMALAAFHELGEVITPARLGLTGEKAEQLAGAGMVMGICRIPVPA